MGSGSPGIGTGISPDASTWLVCCEWHDMHPTLSSATSDRLSLGRIGLSPEETPIGEWQRSQNVPIVPPLPVSTNVLKARKTGLCWAYACIEMRHSRYCL